MYLYFIYVHCSIRICLLQSQSPAGMRRRTYWQGPAGRTTLHKLLQLYIHAEHVYVVTCTYVESLYITEMNESYPSTVVP